MTINASSKQLYVIIKRLKTHNIIIIELKPLVKSLPVLGELINTLWKTMYWGVRLNRNKMPTKRRKKTTEFSEQNRVEYKIATTDQISVPLISHLWGFQAKNNR